MRNIDVLNGDSRLTLWRMQAIMPRGISGRCQYNFPSQNVPPSIKNSKSNCFFLFSHFAVDTSSDLLISPSTALDIRKQAMYFKSVDLKHLFDGVIKVRVRKLSYPPLQIKYPTGKIIKTNRHPPSLLFSYV